MRPFFERLRQRRVVEWGVAYLGGAWLSLEVVDLLADNLDWPAWIFRSVLVLLSVGLASALVLAWYHGARGRQRVSGAEVLILAGLMLVGGTAVAWVNTADDRSSGSATHLDQAGLGGRPASGGPPDIRSLAVLPLETIAPDPESEAWLTDGMTELLTAELSRIRALTVISRSSAMRYRGSDKPLPQIASELGVDGLLEGSVFHAGDDVRITLQLIHGPSDRHLWSGTYQRSLSNILDLQAEVVRAVTQEVEVTLTAGERDRLARPRPVDPAAYEAYARARTLMSAVTPDHHARALPLIRSAIEADSSWAAPWALLADWHSFSTYFGVAPTEAGPLMRDAASAAIARDSLSAEAQYALALYYAEFAWDWDRADATFRRALSLDPSNAAARVGYATHLAIWGRKTEAIEHARRGVELDPLTNAPRAQLALALQVAGRYEEATGVARRAIEMDPTFNVAYYRLAWTLYESGRPEEAVATVERWFEAFPADSNPLTLVMAAEVHAHAGLEDRARAYLAVVLEATTGSYVIPSHVASVYMGLGERDEALRWLQRAYQSRDPNLVFFVAAPWMRPLHTEPEFQDLARRLDVPATAWR